MMVRTGCCRGEVRRSGRRRRVLNEASPVMVRTGYCLAGVLLAVLQFPDVTREPAPRLASVLAGRLALRPMTLPALLAQLLLGPAVPMAVRLPARESRLGFRGPFPVPSARGQPGWLPLAAQEWRTLVLQREPASPWRTPGLPQAWLVLEQPVRLLVPGMRREVSSRRVPQLSMRRNGQTRPVPAVWLLHLLK